MKLREFFSTKSLTEGGNVFQGKTASIKREHIGPTLDRYFSELRQLFPRKADMFNLNHFIALGSVGKKPVSGDIDLGVDASSILNKEMSASSIKEWGIDPKAVDTQQEKLAKRARSATPEQLRMKAFLQLLVKKINSSASNIHMDEKKVTPGNVFGFFPQYDEEGNSLEIGVQIDWMVGNLEWLKFSYFSGEYPENSNVKGLHRTQLLLSMLQAIGLSFNHVSGVTDKETGKVVARNSDQVRKLLDKRAGISISQNEMEDYYDLHDALKNQASKEIYDTAIDIYFKILDRTRADIPDNLQNEWLQRKERLGLTGKFLPDNSKLARYKVTESGVAGANRVPNRQAFKIFLRDYEKLISQFPGYMSMKPTGSYNSDPDKNDFGDIDLVVHIESDKDKKTVKKELQQFFQSQPETVIVPFSSEKHAGKRTYNAGELVSVRFYSNKLGDSAQIDNMVALSSKEAAYKTQFLDFEASKQGLLLGLVKVATIETDPEILLKYLGIKMPRLKKNQELEFNLSSVELQLRIVDYHPGTFKQKGRQTIWSSKDFTDLETILYQYDLSDNFEGLLKQADKEVKKDRSKRRIVGVFDSMITVKSGEVGTPKGEAKEAASRAVHKTFGV